MTLQWHDNSAAGNPQMPSYNNFAGYPDHPLGGLFDMVPLSVGGKWILEDLLP
jgi:hypothetical protein